MIALVVVAVYALLWVLSTAVVIRYRERFPAEEDTLPPAFTGAVWPLWAVAGTILGIGAGVSWFAEAVARLASRLTGGDE